MRAFILMGIAAVFIAGGCKKKVETAKLTIGVKSPVDQPAAAPKPVLDQVPALDNPKPFAAPGPGGGVVANPGPVAGGGGGGGAVQAVRGAVKKTVDANDMRQIHTFIEYASGASGRMPSTETTRAALKQEAPEIERKIYEGLIVLCAAKNREEIWAYEAKALESGGLVATNNGVETMDAANLKRRLGK